MNYIPKRKKKRIWGFYITFFNKYGLYTKRFRNMVFIPKLYKIWIIHQNLKKNGFQLNKYGLYTKTNITRAKLKKKIHQKI